MKFLFLVQGEGRGHMTQAIALSKILVDSGHEVVHTFIGKSNRRNIPNYFIKEIESDVTAIPSPNFILDKENKAISLPESIAYNLLFLRKFKKSLDIIHQKVKQTKPHAIINLYEFLGGLYFRFYNTKNIKHICIGHQFLSNHPNFPFAPDRKIEKFIFLLNNNIFSQNCDKFLALSFRPYDPIQVKNTVVVPPLLNLKSKNKNTKNGNFFMGYMVNDGYAEEVISWHRDNMDTELHFFWDRKDMPEKYVPHEHLTFHQINNNLFSELMENCKGYISTAGFESICEAMYLKKPVLMIPVQGQYEQACNAIDAKNSGAGIIGSSFDISLLMDFLPDYKPANKFVQWTDQANSIFLKEITNI